MTQNLESSTAFSPSLTNMSDASERILKTTVDTLTALRLEIIDEDWVQDVWEAQVRYFCWKI